jgi:hypothetical protein
MVLGLTLFLAAFTAACDNNPLKDDRDKGAYMFTNPSFGTLRLNGTSPVIARVMNKYTAPTGDAVTATPCDAKISVVKDTSRTEFEAPERFLVTGNTLGRSCMIVTGGGITDTIDFVIGIAFLKLNVDSTLISGTQNPLSATFQDANRVATTQLTDTMVTFVSRDTTIVKLDTINHTYIARSPGSVYVVATSKSGLLGQSARDSIPVTVLPQTFNGTFTPTVLPRGGLVTLTAGSVPFDANTAVTLTTTAVTKISQTPTTFTFVVPTTIVPDTATMFIKNMGPAETSQAVKVAIGPTAQFTGTKPATVQFGALTTLTGGADPFDADTKVAVNGVDALIVTQTATTLQFITPEVPAAGATVPIVLSNVGPSQLASAFTAAYDPTFANTGEPDDTPATAHPFVLGTTVNGQLTATDTDDLYSFTLGATTSVTLDVAFQGAGSDIDVYILNSAGGDTGRYNCATAANPEHCVYSLPAGTYYIDLYMYAGSKVPYKLNIK